MPSFVVEFLPVLVDTASYIGFKKSSMTPFTYKLQNYKHSPTTTAYNIITRPYYDVPLIESYKKEKC